MKKAMVLALCALTLLPALLPLAGAESPAFGMPPLTTTAQMIDGDGNVIFSDALIEKAVRENLGLPEGPLTPKQLAKVGTDNEQLNILSPTITPADLSVLQFCTKLKRLYLERVTPINLGAVTAVESLTYFGATQIQISDLRFLVGLGRLSDVWISDCPCKDISAVAEMPRLVNFSIDTRVSDMTPLYRCRNLSNLDVARQSDTEVNDLLDHLGPQLAYLGLYTCAITDATLQRIAGLKLRGIMLDSIGVRSLAPLWGMSSLRDITLYNQRLQTLDGIEGMKKLRSIRLIGITRLTDYRPLFAQPSIASIQLSGVQAPDLQGIEKAANLREFSLEAMEGTVDLTPLFALSKLKRLSLHTVSLTTLTGIDGLRALTDLELYSVMGVTDFTPLSGLKNLERVGTDMAEKLPAGLPVS